MDLLTHSLTGVMLARVLPGVSAEFDKGWKPAAFLAGASLIPDLDIASRAWGVLPYLEIHRGYTHSLLAAPILAGVVTLCARGRWRLFGACLGAILLHLAMDAMNVHGVGLLLPFSDKRFHGDIAFQTDPLIVLPMLFALAMPPLLGMIGSTISQRREETPTRGFAWFAIAVATLYCGARVYAHQQAVAMVRSLAEPGADAIHAFPMRFSLTQWRGVVEREDMTTEVPVDLQTGAYRVLAVWPRQPGDERVDELIASANFRFALRFAEVPVWKVTAQADVTMLQLIDLRFGASFDPQFYAEAVRQRNGTIEGKGFTIGPGFE